MKRQMLSLVRMTTMGGLILSSLASPAHAQDCRQEIRVTCRSAERASSITARRFTIPWRISRNGWSVVRSLCNMIRSMVIWKSVLEQLSDSRQLADTGVFQDQLPVQEDFPAGAARAVLQRRRIRGPGSRRQGVGVRLLRSQAGSHFLYPRRTEGRSPRIPARRARLHHQPRRARNPQRARVSCCARFTPILPARKP